MSFKAMAWATEQEITTTSPQSHLLLILASFANEQNECYPSIATIEKKTRLSHNTIRKCIKELIDFGLIADTKKTSQFNTKVYKLNVDLVGVGIPNLSDTPTKNGSPTNFNTPTNFGMTPLPNLSDTPTKFGSEPLPNLVDNPVINPINIIHKETCYSETHTHETQADENHQSTKSPKKTASAKKTDTRLNPNGIEKPAELDNQIWLDFLKVKKRRTKEDLSITAWNRFISQVLLAQEKTNHSLDEIFGFWIGETKWVGFNCDWYLDRCQPKTTAQPSKFYGTPADPLAVNQKHFPTPPNWEENLAKAMAMGSNPIGLTEI